MAELMVELAQLVECVDRILVLIPRWGAAVIAVAFMLGLSAWLWFRGTEAV